MSSNSKLYWDSTLKFLKAPFFKHYLHFAKNETWYINVLRNQSKFCILLRNQSKFWATIFLPCTTVLKHWIWGFEELRTEHTFHAIHARELWTAIAEELTVGTVHANLECSRGSFLFVTCEACSPVQIDNYTIYFWKALTRKRLSSYCYFLLFLPADSLYI